MIAVGPFQHRILPDSLTMPFQVRLAIAEKALKCEEHDVNLPLSEHNEPWFMRLNSSGEVPVLIHGENIICEATQIIDYLEATFVDGNPKDVSMHHLSNVFCSSVRVSSVSLHVCFVHEHKMFTIPQVNGLFW